MMEPLRKTWNQTVTLHASRQLKRPGKTKKKKKRKKKRKSNFVTYVLEQTTGCLLSWTLIHNRRKKSEAPPTCPGGRACRAEPSNHHTPSQVDGQPAPPQPPHGAPSPWKPSPLLHPTKVMDVSACVCVCLLMNKGAFCVSTLSPTSSPPSLTFYYELLGD